MSRLKYHVVTGTLLLAGGVRVSGTGETTDKKVQEQLRDLAKVMNAFGTPAYVVVEDVTDDDQGGADTGSAGADTGNTGKPDAGNDAPPASVKIPDGVQQKDFDTVQEILKDAGYTFESAHALTDDALDKIKGVAAGRIALIRAVGAANGYAGPQE